jgi:hypothetical protein
MIIMMLYTSLSQETVQETVNSPTRTEYERLARNFGNALSCPCTHIAVPQGKFISITRSVHQVCNSDFVSPVWLNFLGSLYSWDLYYVDFRLVGLPNFQLLSQFCSLSEQTIVDALFLFDNTQFISSHVLMEADLRSQTVALAAEFATSAEQSFAHELALIRATTQGNQLLTGTYANFGLPVYNSTTNDSVAVVDIVPGYIPLANGSPCFCARENTCVELMAIYYFNGYLDVISTVFTIPSFYFGCILVDSLLQSTLECFFDNTRCLEDLLTYLTNDTSSINITQLVATRPSQFQPNTSIGVLLQNLFVEEWSTNVSFASYFASCAPKSCTYTYPKRKSLLYVLTTLLGIYGGLSVALRLIIPILFEHIGQHIRKWRLRRSSPISTISSSNAVGE